MGTESESRAGAPAGPGAPRMLVSQTDVAQLPTNPGLHCSPDTLALASWDWGPTEARRSGKGEAEPHRRTKQSEAEGHTPLLPCNVWCGGGGRRGPQGTVASGQREPAIHSLPCPLDPPGPWGKGRNGFVCCFLLNSFSGGWQEIWDYFHFLCRRELLRVIYY